MDAIEIQKKCIELLKMNKLNDIDLLIDRLLEKHHTVQTLSLFSNIYCWLSGKTGDLFYIEKGLYYAEVSRLIFDKYVKQELKDKNKLNFVLPITQPKSGGTFIFDYLHNYLDYNKHIIYTYGKNNNIYISESRVKTVFNYGGCITHSHLMPNTHNLSVIKKLNIPIWIHIRDPRDAFFSFLNMYLSSKEEFKLSFYKNHHLRTNIYNNINTDFIQESIDVTNINELGLKLMWMLEYYCEWITAWIKFDYKNKFITHFHELQNNEIDFIDKINNVVFKNNIDKTNIMLPEKNFSRNRFFYGINNRWQKILNKKLIDNISYIYKKYDLESIFSH